MPFQKWMGAPMVVNRAAILLLLQLVLLLVTLAADERQAGIVGRQRRQDVLLLEKATLLAFKRGLTLLKPSALADWNESNGNVCGFTGVTCDWRREHVAVLALGDMNIQGAIPPVVGNLSHLRSLNMSFNYISGAIPPSVGNLLHLRSLDMSYNNITGAIPPSVGNLSHLENLDISNNLISGAIPPSVGNLLHLRSLDMSYNDITGAIPPSVGNLSHLSHLDISYNLISGATPPSVGNLSLLQNLDISSNHISGSITPVIGNLSLLQNLDMSYNLLTGHIPAELSNLRSLGSLDLGKNYISGGIPRSLAKLPSLSKLNLEYNSLSGSIPPSFGNLSLLHNLDMSRNLLTGQVPAELSNLRSIGALNLGQNQLRGGIPPSLAELTSMYYLSLENNNLSGPIPAAIFKNCTSLGVVQLGDNHLSGLIPQDASSTINETFAVLSLYSNRLIGTLPRWLANCTYLIGLDVENNFLTDELPTGIISGKRYLNYLHLSNNRFLSQDGNTNLEPFFAAISSCTKILEIEAGAVGMGGRLPSRLGSMLPPNMSTLNLELNEIVGPIPADIGDVINITLMNLSSNLLNGTIPASLCQLPKLQRLVLSKNALTGKIPPCIGNAKSLGELDLSDNALSGIIPSGIGNLTQLVNLCLQGNRLSGEIPASLAQCKALLSLDLSSNRLTGEVPHDVSGIVMISLNLSRNQLGGELTLGLSDMQMQQVQAIDLSRNNFNGAIFQELGRCAELEILDLSHNSLAGALPSSLDGLESLENLDVSNNSLTGEIPLTLTKCTRLTHLNLSYNDFVGDVPTTGAFAHFTFLSYLGNPQLCGPVVRRNCRRHHPWYQSRKFLVVMCVCAAVLAFVLTILCTISIHKIRERLAAVREEMFKGRRSGGSSPVMKYKYPRITYRELVEATDDFCPDRLVGTGSYGRVYRGTLRDGTMVAVKVLQLQTGNSTKSFNRECQVLKRIRHRNLMRIVTACSLPDFKALVLPFMANGSLERCLYAGPIAELSLVQRVNICSDIAEGMAYLHHHSPVKVIHCDLKPSNVLINDDMTALVSDFGISRLVMTVGGAANTADVGASTANMLCGSIGYIPPEYGYGSNPTTKGDVYSFGVLVLEMVTRRKPTDDMFEAGLSLHKWVKSHYHGRADAVVDAALARMVRDQTPEVRRMSDVAIDELLELGILCTQESASTRPTMMDAADDLDRLKLYLGGDTTATFASSLGFTSTTFEDTDD